MRCSLLVLYVPVSVLLNVGMICLLLLHQNGYNVVVKLSAYIVSGCGIMLPKFGPKSRS